MDGGNLFLQALNLAINWGADRIGKRKPVTLADIMPEESANAPTVQQLQKQATQVPGVSGSDLVKYQNRELVKEMVLLEAHLLQQCKIDGKACDCCSKHPIALEGLARETLGMTTKPIYSEIADWAKEIADKTTPEASASGRFDSEYLQMAVKLRDLRKRVIVEAVPGIKT
jgi:hypothetical protein